MRVLAIETSCDETAVAILEDRDGQINVLSNIVYSQMDLHAKYGGVYPEVASREHVAKILPVIKEAIIAASGKNLPPKTHDPKPEIDFIRNEIDLISVTAGPGLIGSLLVGVNAAKTLAYSFDKPILGINHHEGHIAAAWLSPADGNLKSPAHNASQSDPGGQISNLKQPSNDENPKPNTQHPVPALPALALVVSGGHTQLVKIDRPGSFERIGRTRDDAAGEAFDKVARLIDLPYPGGPAISKLATTYNPTPTTHNLSLPRPMLDSGDLDFSFSGLKTAVATLVAKQDKITDEFKAALAHEFQEAVVDVLVQKTMRAVEIHQPKSLILAGGVATNRRLRQALVEAQNLSPITYNLDIPPVEYCTDNAAMIGAAAILRARNDETGAWAQIVANDRLTLSEVSRS